MAQLLLERPASRVYTYRHALPQSAELPIPSTRRFRWRRPSPFAVTASIVFVLAIFQNFYRLSVAPLLSNEDLYARMGWLYVHWWSVPSAEQTSEVTNVEHPPFAKLLFGLAELAVGHPSVTAARAVAAVCVIATSMLIAWWVGRVVGPWVGLVAGGTLALIPMPIYTVTTRFGRAAELDNVAQFFMVAGLVAGWHWSRASGRRAWDLAVVTGLMVGLATASKENGCLGMVGPILLMFAWSRTSWSRLGRWLAQAVIFAASAVASFSLCYLPFGDIVGRIHYMVTFQSDHSVRGHLIGFAGTVDIHPPWWTNFWFAGHSLGATLSIVLSATALLAVLVRRGPLTAWLACSLAAPIVFHCFYAGVALPYYWTLWAPAFIALSAIGISDVTRAVRSAAFGRRAVACVAALAIASALAAAVASETFRIATLQPQGARVVATIRAERGLHGQILTMGTYTDEIAPLLPNTVLLTRLPKQLNVIDTIIMAQPRCGRLIPRMFRALINVNVAAGSLRLAHTDRLMRIYLVAGPLIRPTAAESLAEPAGHLADNC